MQKITIQPKYVLVIAFIAFMIVLGTSSMMPVRVNPSEEVYFTYQ